MPIDDNFPVASIEQLSSTIRSQASNLQSTLSQLRSQCQRDPNFTGNAAQRYDEYMQKWDTSQRGLVEALDGAGNVLSQLAAHLREEGANAAAAFNV